MTDTGSSSIFSVIRKNYSSYYRRLKSNKEDTTMKQKHIDASREIRLWMVQVIGPAAAAYILVNKPEVLDTIKGRIMNSWWLGR